VRGTKQQLAVEKRKESSAQNQSDARTDTRAAARALESQARTQQVSQSSLLQLTTHKKKIKMKRESRENE
jgi:hypothetical protein